MAVDTVGVDHVDEGTAIVDEAGRERAVRQVPGDVEVGEPGPQALDFLGSDGEVIEDAAAGQTGQASQQVAEDGFLDGGPLAGAQGGEVALAHVAVVGLRVQSCFRHARGGQQLLADHGAWATESVLG